MKHRSYLGLLLLMVAGVSDAFAQERTVTVPSSTEYDRSAFWQMLFGKTWRPDWSAKVTAPVLDIGSYKGGLKPYKAGGNQSRTLRFRGGDGRTYIFRSINKDVQRKALPDDLRHTPIGEVIQDQTSSMHPSGALAVKVLQDAVGLLQAPPTLVWLPDDERLGEYRKDFGNSLGFIEERPDEAEEGKTFAGAEKIQGTDKLLDKLEESMEDRLVSSDYLTARLIDFIIGDTDRGADQWRFAKFEAGDRDIYRPIPRDRDYAFMETGGLLIRIGQMLYPKLTTFRNEFPKLRSLVFMTREFDRSHLVDLSPAQWDSVVAFIQQRLTDQVIADAVAQLPQAHQQLSGDVISAGLRARRDGLADIARQYYLMVNGDAEVFASDENERADIQRNADGTVDVRIWREGAGGESVTNGQHSPAFERRFYPADTDEIRVFMERGNDRVVVRGTVERSIEVRVIGGEDDDVLIDSSQVAKGDRTHFYDAHGNNTFVTASNTRVIRTPYVTPPPACALDEEDCEKPKDERVLSEERRGRQQDLANKGVSFIDSKTRSEASRSWGKVASWSPLFGYRDHHGVIVGFGPLITDYGFRRRPFETRIAVHGMVGVMTGNVGVQLQADRHFEKEPVSIGLFAHATQLEMNRFYGYGNNTMLIEPKFAIIERDEVMVQPSLTMRAGDFTRFAVAPFVRFMKADIAEGPGGDCAILPDCDETYGYTGARVSATYDRAQLTPLQQKGFALQLSATGVPELLDAEATFTSAEALARAYVPLSNATLALRAGGKKVWGDSFPLVEAALIGGGTTVRGYQWNRFAGDASAYGSVELRVPLMRMTLLTRGTLGVLGFSDAGRVWMDTSSPFDPRNYNDGDWHTSFGGGLWFGSLGQAVSVTYARGEEGRMYFSFGQPF